MVLVLLWMFAAAKLDGLELSATNSHALVLQARHQTFVLDMEPALHLILANVPLDTLALNATNLVAMVFPIPIALFALDMEPALLPMFAIVLAVTLVLIAPNSPALVPQALNLEFALDTAHAQHLTPAHANLAGLVLNASKKLLQLAVV
jgi:hypothetical protein